MVAKIKKAKEFDKLAFLISTASVTLVIPKTIVFVDSLDKKVMLAIYFQNLLSEYIKDYGERLIKTFTLILKLNRKAKYLEDFCNDNTRIYICTNTTRMGVNLENIV